MGAIPKLIHQIWISPGPSVPEMPIDVTGDTAQWKALHADFQHKIWSIDAVYALASQSKFENIPGQEIVDLIKICRFPAMKADIGRLLILHHFGGFWVDLKLVPKKSFLDDLRHFELVLAEHQKTPEYPDPAKYKLMNNWFFACKPGSPFVAEAISVAINNVRQRIDGVWHVTGPGVFMQVQEKMYPLAFEGHYPDIKLLKADEYMDALVGYGWGSYNKNGMHWSERQKNEPIYDE